MNFTVEEFRLKIYPQNFERVRAFYAETLGLTIIEEWNEVDTRGVMFAVGNTTLELLTPALSPVRGADVSWAVSDVWTLWEELRHAAPIVHDLRDNAWGDTSFCIADPEGFAITFFTTHK